MHIDVTEVPTFPSGGLPGEEVGDGPAFCGQLGVGRCHAVRLLEADAVHQLERTLGPTKANLGSAVNVFHRANVLLHNLRSHAKDDAKQALADRSIGRLIVGAVVLDRPHLAGLDQRTEIAGARVPWRVQLLRKVIGGVQGNGWPGEVHQAKWTEANAEGLARDGVDLRCGSNALLEQQAGFVEPRHKEAVDHEAWTVGTDDDHLAEGLAVLDGAFDGFSAGRRGGDDLHQAVLCRVVEEMQANETVRSTGGLRQRVHGQGRGVGRKDGVRLTDVVEGGEDRGLDVKILEHRFDDQVGGRRCVFRADDALDTALDGGHFGFREDPSLHRFFEEAGDDPLATIDPRLLAVYHLDVEAFLC